MSAIFAQVTAFLGAGVQAFWYHFAIMFEALFILTTVDAGTRVGRFMIQDLVGNVWAPFGRTSWLPANLVASALIVAAWGYFLYAGVNDPQGGIYTLFPLFGIANQLLAAVALTVGTTILIKMGKLKYAWVTALPLAWDAAVTLTASWQKIFSPDPLLGFFAQRSAAIEAARNGELYGNAENAADVQQIIVNSTVDGILSILFAAMIIIVMVRHHPGREGAHDGRGALGRVAPRLRGTRDRGARGGEKLGKSEQPSAGHPGVLEGDLGRERLRSLPGAPHRDPP
jgi:carbon starvation protein